MRLKNALLLICFLAGGFFTTTNAQDLKFPGLDKSPLDAAHYPPRAAYNNYLDEKEDLMIKVIYSRPKKNDRVIFGELVPHGAEWRFGANEATEITFYQPVEIGGKMLRGSYTMFAETYPNNWVIKFSTERNIGGTRDRDKSQDVVAVNVPLEFTADSRESFTIGFKKVDEGNCNMIVEWDRTRAVVPISFNTETLAADDASPMDIAQYPRNSRLRNLMSKEERKTAIPRIKVVYNRPQVKGRTIFGDLVPYGEMWRVGANETTEITFFQDVKIGGKEVKRGRYGIFATVNKDKWDVVLHKNLPSWGNANHDASTNVAEFSVPTAKTPEMVEALGILFDKKDDKNVHMIIGWENTMVRIPVELMIK
ncbi:MAG: DUF2911 domain-containing protein [Bacteroidota bacterium]